MKRAKKRPPTKSGDRRGSRSAGKSADSDRNPESRGKLNPEIFVLRSMPGPYGQIYARAHLRNKKGDVFLCWRDKNRTRNFYLGRRKQKPPTIDIGCSSGPGDVDGRRRHRAP